MDLIMKKTFDWKYDELAFSGTDFTDLKIVEEYDKKHSSFRDYKKETEERLSALNLAPDAEIIDLGCGTGAFTLNAAPRCGKVYAVDVSRMMLEYTKKKAKEKGLDNIEFINGGLLSYEHKAKPADALISSMVLHHLPDFWKQIALKRVHDMLKPGGKFYLFDVVYSFNYMDHAKVFDEWVAQFMKSNGEEFTKQAAGHISREYSTFSWILEEMLKRAGFEIDSLVCDNEMLAKFICIRK
jgi:ubiquinone/menaquinone biosynthesis C-methylase UbiE